MKQAGTKQYPYIAYSPSDKAALGFDTEALAQSHASRTN